MMRMHEHLLANRRQKARVEVVEETRIKMPDEGQVGIENAAAGSKKSREKTVVSKKREPKRMTYLEALRKSKTVLGDYDQIQD